MQKFLSKLFGRNHLQPVRRKPRRLAAPECLERREVMAADPLPVLLVIADQRDFYYQEYNDTRLSLEPAGLEVDVAATTTNPSLPHPGTGQGTGSGVVNPDLRLDTVKRRITRPSSSSAAGALRPTSTHSREPITMPPTTAIGRPRKS